MFRRTGPKRYDLDSDAHLHNEQAMEAIELEMLNNIHEQIGYRPRFFSAAKIRYAVAASVLLICVGAWFFINSLYSSGKVLTASAQNGHMATISLPDGSTVWLNSGSTISYPSKFSKQREVQLLNGEAFFQIKHDEQHPFIVHYGNLHTQVLGTSFNIKYYKKLNDVRVTVVTGLVAVGDKTKSFGLLQPNKELIYHQQQKKYDTRTVNAAKVAAWRNREVNLYDVPFEDLVLNIENSYNVRLNYNRRQMKDVVVTIHFSSADDMTQVLEIIKAIYRLNYSIKGKEVVLH
ncbi:FecR family protein [Mucilaginibacter yixingensis]|uniref:FecR family protein n=1 Tax=Mucilaginibacter yixingensis TaxID=1295612 RepID=A0A2T5JGJ6_9SPHI|nr:FecR family protein [Mucilaginibacter yixingensis]PTR01563.1 FecR family protein [Mucilaginibacter yixingensis]